MPHRLWVYGVEATMVDFPVHNPDFPDVDPATGDERETTDGEGLPVLGPGETYLSPDNVEHLKRLGMWPVDDHGRGVIDAQFETAPPEEYDF